MMAHPEFPYDPDLPYVVYRREDAEIISRHKIEFHAMSWARGDYAFADTTPVRRIPRHINMISWIDKDGVSHYARRDMSNREVWEVRYRRGADSMGQASLEQELNEYTIYPLTPGDAL